MWFIESREHSYEYHWTTPYAYTYKVRIHGNILSEESLIEISNKLGINFEDDVLGDLLSNPSASEIKKLIKPYINICDGFYMSEYDPRDSQSKLVKSILVFDPTKTVEIITANVFTIHEKDLQDIYK
jgi:hypothetical protein